MLLFIPLEVSATSDLINFDQAPPHKMFYHYLNTTTRQTKPLVYEPLEDTFKPYSDFNIPMPR